MKKALVFLIVVLVFGFITWKMTHLAQIECHLCIEFNGNRKCTKALGPTEADARKEAQSTLCSNLASGVTEVVACGRAEQQDVTCATLEP